MPLCDVCTLPLQVGYQQFASLMGQCGLGSDDARVYAFARPQTAPAATRPKGACAGASSTKCAKNSNEQQLPHAWLDGAPSMAETAVDKQLQRTVPCFPSGAEPSVRIATAMREPPNGNHIPAGSALDVSNLGTGTSSGAVMLVSGVYEAVPFCWKLTLLCVRRSSAQAQGGHHPGFGGWWCVQSTADGG